MTPMTDTGLLHLALPKGRMQDGVFSLLADAGIRVRAEERGYRPGVSVPGYEVKVLKPQNIVEMLHAGSRDIGFAGADWVAELQVDLAMLLDTGLDPVRIVAAAPVAVLDHGRLPRRLLDGAQSRPLVVASEYTRITNDWIAAQKLTATFVRSYGATEVFPPEDADCIVDVTQTGATLKANGLAIVDELMTSSTRLYANPRVLDNPAKRDAIEGLVLLLKSVLEARARVMLEVNVSAENLEALVKILPCMREPTISTLHGGAGYAVKVAAPRKDLPRLIPEIKKVGGTDVVVYNLNQIVP